LQVGQSIGVYSDYMEGEEDEVAVAHFVVRNPRPQSASIAALTLEQLSKRSRLAGLTLFAVVAGFIGLFIGGADGLICRLPRRALLCGFIGLLVGVVGGFVCSIAANVVYSPLTLLAQKTSENSPGLGTFGFVIQMFGRAAAWCLAGVAMG